MAGIGLMLFVGLAIFGGQLLGWGDAHGHAIRIGLLLSFVGGYLAAGGRVAR